MAPPTELYKIAILLCPVFSSLFAILILLLDIRNSHRKPLKLNYYLLAYFSAVFITWFSALLYFYVPGVYVYINCISMLAFILVQIFYYGFIFEVTRINKQEIFSNLNYLLPILLSLSLLIISLVTPFHEQLAVIESKGVYTGGSKLFFYLNYSKILLRLVFSLVYTILSFRRLSRYRSFIINFSSNTEKGSLRWVSVLLLFSVLLISFPLLKLFASREEMVSSPIAIFLVLSLLCQYVYICLHVVKKDQFMVDLSGETNLTYTHNCVGEKIQPPFNSVHCKKLVPNKIKTVEEVVNSEIIEKYQMDPVALAKVNNVEDDEVATYLKKNALTRETFDAFMKAKKPYLNADMRITDLVDMLHVNRTYISTFINKEYGVNFSVFINMYRLQEYNTLKEMPEYSKMNKSELAEMAGFNSYRNFHRTEKEGSGNTKREI